jgi:hypothetical protein
MRIREVETKKQKKINANAKSTGAARARVARTLVGCIAVCTMFAAGARAQCGSVPPQVAALAPGLGAMQRPAIIWPEALSQQAESIQAQGEDASDAPIIGMWKATYVSGGMTVDVGFEQWHSDGTEILNDTPPPASGNVCLGAWEKTGPRTYSLVHPAFNFNSAGTAVVSIFIEREQVTVTPDGNSFTGTFTWDSYDFAGHPLPGTHLAGTVAGKRIKVGAPFPFPFPL